MTTNSSDQIRLAQAAPTDAGQHPVDTGPHAAVDAGPPPAAPSASAGLTREVGGRDGPDPTRFGDWELRGRCIDF